MNDHIRSVFIFAFTARTRGLIDTDEKQNTLPSSGNLREGKLRQKMTGKHFQWTGQQVCAKRTTSFNHRKHYVDSLLLRFQRMLLLAWKELKYVSISYILLFFEDVPQLFFVANIKSWELEIAFSNHKAALKIMKKLQGQSFTIVVLLDF